MAKQWKQAFREEIYESLPEVLKKAVFRVGKEKINRPIREKIQTPG